VWSWGQGTLWQEGSVHRAPWPESTALRAAAADGDPLVLDVAAAVLGEIRKAKTAAHVSMRAEADRVIVRDTPARLAALAGAAADVGEAGRVSEMLTEEADAFSVDVTLVGG